MESPESVCFFIRMSSSFDLKDDYGMPELLQDEEVVEFAETESDDRATRKKLSDSYESSKSKQRSSSDLDNVSNRTRNSSSSNSGGGGSSKASRMASEHNSRSQSPKLNQSFSLEGADARPLKFEIGPPIDSNYFGVQQESFSSIAYGGLSHHAISRLSATSSLNEADYTLDDSASIHSSSQVPVFDESLRRLERKSSSLDLYGTPPSTSDTPPPLAPFSQPQVPLIFPSTSSTPSIAGQSSNGVRKKKSSWNSALFPTYKSRSSEFKKLFPNLPLEERLVVDFSCALQKDILVHGRIYCTINFLCFYANIFRCKTLIAIRWEDVISVTKEKMALVFPNAIQISTKADKHFFTSFAARDKTYAMLFKLWLNACLRQPASPLELWQWVHSFYGDELGLTSEDEADYVSPFAGVTPSTSQFMACDDSPQFAHSRKLSKSATSPANLSDSIFEMSNPLLLAPTTGNSSRSNTSSENGGGRQLGKIEESGGCQSEGVGEDVSDGPAEVSSRGRPRSLQVTGEPGRVGVSRKKRTVSGGLSVSELSDLSTESESDLPQSNSNGGIEGLFDHIKSDSTGRPRSRVTLDTWRLTQEGRELTCQSFPVDVDTLFELLFTNSDFFIDFHTARKTLDIVQSPWQLKDDGSMDKVREVSFTLSLTNSMGYKHSQVTETQLMSNESCPGQIYIVNVESNNSGIPYAESFYVTSHFCLSRVGDKESNLCVISSIKYKKVVWGLVKSIIEKNTWAGLEDFYTSLASSLHIVTNNMAQGANPGVKKVKKRSRNQTSKADFEAKENQNRELATSSGPKRGRSTVSGSLVNGVLVGDIGSLGGRPPSATSGLGGTSLAVNNFLIKFILVLLSSLLLVNILLFYRLYNLEARLNPDVKEGTRFTPDVNLFIVKPDFPRSEDDWLRLIQRQEALHQIELEKWHEVLGSATHLLKQTEESLSDLQKTIHPMALKKLRHLLLLQDFENTPDGITSTKKQETEFEADKGDIQPKGSSEKSEQETQSSSKKQMESDQKLKQEL